MQSNFPFFIAITGATGVGKSDIAQQLAEKINGHIVNMDMGQMYAPLSIGTAKPEWKTNVVKHSLFDVIEEPVSWSAVAYSARVKSLLQEIWNNKETPILVGGSGFYLKSLLFTSPLSFVPKEEVSSTSYSKEPDELWKELRAIDEKRAAQIHPHDTYRVKRALDIWHQTGTLPSAAKPIYNPFCSYILIVIERDTPTLYERINKRVNAMMAQGWIEEVKSLLQTAWVPFLQSKKIIGYNEIIDYLSNTPSFSYEDLITKIQQKTAGYAQRQRIFFKMLKKELSFFDNYDKVKELRKVVKTIHVQDVLPPISEIVSSFQFENF